MTYNFEYAGQITYTGEYIVNDINCCALKADNGLGKCYFIKIFSELGETFIEQFGPVYNDNEQWLIYNSFDYRYDKIQYSEKKIISTITKFLNNGEIQNVEEIEFDEFNLILRGIKNVECH